MRKKNCLWFPLIVFYLNMTNMSGLLMIRIYSIMSELLMYKNYMNYMGFCPIFYIF